MPQSEAHAWWADVQHVREAIERRRAADALPRLSGFAEEGAGRGDHRSDSLVHHAGGADAPRPPRRHGDGAAATARRRSRTHRGAAEAAFPVDWDEPARRSRAPEASSGRRTVQITGRAVPAPALPRLVEVERRRPARRPAERIGGRPDRVALWAVLLGFFLIAVAATSSAHAASGADARPLGHHASRLAPRAALPRPSAAARAEHAARLAGALR